MHAIVWIYHSKAIVFQTLQTQAPFWRWLPTHVLDVDLGTQSDEHFDSFYVTLLRSLVEHILALRATPANSTIVSEKNITADTRTQDRDLFQPQKRSADWEICPSQNDLGC